jgi:hypothetical protein
MYVDGGGGAAVASRDTVFNPVIVKSAEGFSCRLSTYTEVVAVTTKLVPAETCKLLCEKLVVHKAAATAQVNIFFMYLYF